MFVIVSHEAPSTQPCIQLVLNQCLWGEKMLKLMLDVRTIQLENSECQAKVFGFHSIGI